jgi:hypothetical protein
MINNTRKKSVISLISYDAQYLPESIASYYEYVDEIVLGLDKDRISWSNNKFSLDESLLWSQLTKLDHANKISIIEENFHRSRIPIENDTHERNFLKSKCEYDWIFSFDADETLVNAREFFIDFCPLIQDYKHVELMFTWYLLYKQVEDGYLIIADETRDHVFKKDIQGFTADRDLHTFTYCRWTNSQKKVLSPLAIKHYSFCRSQEDLAKKVNNFGHSVESKQDSFYETQKQINKQNYTSLRNFKTHGSGHQWPTLKFVPKKDIDKYLQEESRLIYEN